VPEIADQTPTRGPLVAAPWPSASIISRSDTCLRQWFLTCANAEPAHRLKAQDRRGATELAVPTFTQWGHGNDHGSITRMHPAAGRPRAGVQAASALTSAHRLPDRAITAAAQEVAASSTWLWSYKTVATPARARGASRCRRRPDAHSQAQRTWHQPRYRRRRGRPSGHGFASCHCAILTFRLCWRYACEAKR
jgi:hypothetical protein